MIWFLLLTQMLPMSAAAMVKARGLFPIDDDQTPFNADHIQNHHEGAPWLQQELQILGKIDKPSRMRALQQTAAVTVVTTAQQLLDAVEDGAGHIEIRAHLDLTTVQPLGTTLRQTMLTDRTQTLANFKTQSIRGKCDSEPPLEEPFVQGLEDWQPGQCVLVTDISLMQIDTSIWLDSLHIHHQHTDRTDTESVISCESRACQLWMTNVSLKGDVKQDPLRNAIVLSGGEVYAQGLLVTDFMSQEAVVLIEDGATVSMQQCSFTRNSLNGTTRNEAIISVHGQNTILRLQNCDFTANDAFYDLSATNDAKIYSDMKFEVFMNDNIASVGVASPLQQAPADRPGIDASSPWFLEVQQSSEVSSARASSIASKVATLAVWLSAMLIF